MMTNAYILYCKYHAMHLSTNTVSHYDFIKQVALAWMDPTRYGPRKKNTETAHQPNKKRGRSVVLDSSDDEIEQPRCLRSKKESLETSSTCSIATTSTVKTMRNTRINDESLDPSVGSLRCRLDTFTEHCPKHFDGAKRAMKCQLHRWARDRKGKEVRNAKVLYCTGCNVSLCSKCWAVFHHRRDVIALKDQIAES